MPNIADRIGPYTLVKQIGRGSFGVVWLAERRSAIINTKVALKIPHDDEVDIEMIRHEANVWAQASGHPNVLPIIEADVYDGKIVIVSEFAPDGSLESKLREHGGRASSVEWSAEIISGILAGLAHLHGRNIIHRDLKPANILFQGDTPRLADFGVSRVLKSTAQTTSSAGTPIYMAPEAFDGKRSEQTDIWSVGVIFYQLLTGHLPFEFEDFTSLWAAVTLKEPRPLPEMVPGQVRAIVKKALAKDSGMRFQSSIQMRKQLQTARDGFSVEINNVDTLPFVEASEPTLPTLKQGLRSSPIYVPIIATGLLISLVAFVGFLLISRYIFQTEKDPVVAVANSLVNQSPSSNNGVAITTLFPSRWEGRWKSPNGNDYSAEIQLLNLGEDNKFEGMINWKLEGSKLAARLSKIGMQATEYVRGEYNAQTEMLTMEGYRKSDPEDIITTDKYQLMLSADKQTIFGPTWNRGRWNATITLKRAF